MTPYLLDANALIALTISEHEHFDRVTSWFHDVERSAVSPIVEGALMRYLVRIGVTASSVNALLSAMHDNPRLEFWADDLSLADIDVGHIVGHRQVTDAYLAGLAVHHGGRLATLDEGLHKALPHATLLIPEG